jgi:hypothetical protein
MVAMMCAHGARPDGGHLAQAVARRRSVGTVTALLDAGAPVEGEGSDRPDGSEPTALQLAVRWGDDVLAALLVQRGANPERVTAADRSIGQLGPDALDAMLRLALRQGDVDGVRTLLDLGAPLEGAPGNDFTPLHEAAWSGQAAVVTELVRRGAALSFSGGGSAIGATLHGSRHCVDPEGGPTMAPWEEIPQQPYREIVETLLAAGAAVPERLGADGPRTVTMLAELGIEPPS